MKDWTDMQGSQYCVYNQTSECFLSLGVREGESALGRMGDILASRTRRYDEGQWVQRPGRFHFVRIFSSRDLVFLDDKHRVLGVLESFPPFRFAPVGPQVASVLDLPVETIVSSQTQPGNQLVI